MATGREGRAGGDDARGDAPATTPRADASARRREGSDVSRADASGGDASGGDASEVHATTERDAARRRWNAETRPGREAERRGVVARAEASARRPIAGFASAGIASRTGVRAATKTTTSETEASRHASTRVVHVLRH